MNARKSPSMGRLLSCAWMAGLLLGVVAPAAGQATFTMLSPVDELHTYVSAVTDDGGVVIGSRGGMETHEAFRWTRTGGMEMLGHLPGLVDSTARGMSSQGDIVVGFSGSRNVRRGFVWTEAGGMQELPSPMGWANWSAKSISRDGRIIFGETNWYPVKWVRMGPGVEEGNGGVWEIEMEDWLAGAGYPVAMSADGSSICANRPNIRLGLHWDRSSGFCQLPVYGGDVLTTALNMSADGGTVIGITNHLCGLDQAFLWRPPAEGGSGDVEMLGDLSPGRQSWAYAANWNGSVIVGEAEMQQHPASEGAFIWTRAEGMRALRTLANELGAGIGTTPLTKATAISSDGSVVAGTRRVGEHTYGWVITGLPPACFADFDQSGAVDTHDLFAFLADWFARRARADFNRSSAVEVADLFAFLGEWQKGCN